MSYKVVKFCRYRGPRSMLWPAYEAVTGWVGQRSPCIMDQPLATFCTREACGSGRLTGRDRRRLAGSDRKKSPLIRSEAGGDIHGWWLQLSFFGREYVGDTWVVLQVGRALVRGTGEKIGRSRAAAVPPESRPSSPARHSLYPSFSLLSLSLSIPQLGQAIPQLCRKYPHR